MMSTFSVSGERHALWDEDMCAALKKAAYKLNYPQERRIPLERINTHSLQAGGANMMPLAGYTDRQLQKWADGEGKCLRGTYVKSSTHF